MPIRASGSEEMTEQIPTIVSETHKAYASGKTLPVEFRKAQLKKLIALLDTEKSKLIEALSKDLKKPATEAILTEILIVRNDAVDTLNCLDDWIRPEKPSVGLINKADNCQIRSQPKGVVLIIGAWNYPIQLTLLPLVGAIAAGNAVIIKPSELATATAELLGNLIPKYLDKECFRVINGGLAETTCVLEQQFDHILYTGSGAVGKIVMEKASKFLTPVTLELGGKSPTILDKEADIGIAMRRIIWGKFVNAGQTCIAPDYIIALPGLQQKIVEGARAALAEYYGNDIKKSDAYGRIINERHFNRLKDLHETCKGKTEIGGDFDEKELYISPTLVVNVPIDSKLMKEEIFGPILPVITVESIDEAIKFINSRDKPLALYVFSSNSKTIQKVLHLTSSGGAVANDVLMHASVPQLPFGGIGPSGMGGYHGKHTFDLFSHKRSVMIKRLGMEFVNGIRYPPYTAQKLHLIMHAMKKKIASKSPLPKLIAIIIFVLALVRFPNNRLVRSIRVLLGVD